MKNFLTRHRFKIIFSIAGAIGGLLYWKFVGCTSGTCPITSHWYTMGAYGTLMGYLIGSMFNIRDKEAGA